MLRHHFLIAAALAFAALAMSGLTTPAVAQSTLFKCVDDKGVTHYGETMPAACQKKAVTELTKQGNVVRKLDAPLTPEQLRAKEEEDAKKAAENRRVMEQRQKDLALLGTFGSEREFDVIRDKDVAQITARRKLLEGRGTELDEKIEKLNNELEFYKAGKSRASKEREPPPSLLAAAERARLDRAAVDTELKQLAVEVNTVTTRSANEKERWKKLKAGMRPGTLLDEKGEVLIEGPLVRRAPAQPAPKR